ncbi:MBL fold metallo-hydrolase [Gaopeijia maritima]|uniref:MBL fold metallo-hydrolase n=1 Tax=Gaopeijia maritima TaxID=3119007 RepID=UPI0032466110
MSLWLPQAFGAKPSGARLARIERSPQYRNGRFHNPLARRSDGASLATIWEFFTGGSPHRRPTAPPPHLRRTASDFADPPEAPRVTWLGHASLLVEIDGVRILIDPVWGERPSPFGWVGTRRFHEPPLALDDLPPLDAVLLSHDHYDHLDLPTVRALAGRVPRWITPLGVGAHLERWGVAAERIDEFDWWDETTVEAEGVAARLVCTPSRHFSGRGLRDRDATLWSGWAFVGTEQRLWYAGDSALTPQFLEVGERLGPFDLTMIEVGAYNASWADVHLGPEQAVAAHRMAQGPAVDGRIPGRMLPIHWGTFDLALHGWTEPAERVLAAARAAGVALALPRPGESITPEAAPDERWWPEVAWESAADAPAISTGLDPEVLELVPRP